MDVSDKAGCLRAQEHGHQPVVCYGIENHSADSRVNLQGQNEPCQTLTSQMGTGGGNVPMILETYTQPTFGEFKDGDKAQALKASDGKRVDPGAVVVEQAKPPRKYIVRRLIPLECCRLQGFPDWWCDGVEGSDTAQYKMWGNGIALPCAYDVINRIAREIQKSEYREMRTEEKE